MSVRQQVLLSSLPTRWKNCRCWRTNKTNSPDEQPRSIRAVAGKQSNHFICNFLLITFIYFQSVLFWEFLEERILTEDLFASDSDSDSDDFLGFY